MTCFDKKYSVSATQTQLLQTLSRVCGTLELSVKDNNSFELVSPAICRDLKFLPNAKLRAEIETTDSGLLLHVSLTNVFSSLEVVTCIALFALWVAERVWAWQNHIEGLVIPSWSIKTWVLGPVVALALVSYCLARARQQALLFAALDEAVAISNDRLRTR